MSVKTIQCDICKTDMNPKYATNIARPQSKMVITRNHYQGDDGTLGVCEEFDLCADCMRSFYEWKNQKS